MDELDFLGMLDNISIETYQYFHQLFHNRTLVFNGGIDEDLIERYYLALRDFENDDSTKPVTMIFNSFGGSVTEGFFFAHYLKNYKKPLNIIVTGCAASMAAIILAACNKNPNITRYCYPSSYALIHDGYTAIGAAESKTASDIMAFNDSVDDDMHGEVDRLSIARGAHGEVGGGLVGILARHDQDLAAHRGCQSRGIRVADNTVGNVLIRVVRVGGHTVEVDLDGLRILVEDHVLHGVDDIRRQVGSGPATVEVVHAEISWRDHVVATAS